MLTGHIWLELQGKRHMPMMMINKYETEATPTTKYEPDGRSTSKQDCAQYRVPFPADLNHRHIVYNVRQKRTR